MYETPEKVIKINFKKHMQPVIALKHPQDKMGLMKN